MIRSKIAEIFAHHLRFYESAIRDAATEGFIDGTEPAFKARTIQTYIQGAFTQARVLNDLTPIRLLDRAILAILGVDPDRVSAST